MLYTPHQHRDEKTVMQEAQIPMGRPAPSPPPQPATARTASPQPTTSREEDEEFKSLPMLIASYKIVVPAEATRDVLSGRVPYILVEDEGVTVFKPVHMFAALKLKKETMTHLEDYSCIGAHERFLEKVPKKRVGLGYRRKYISPELIGQGIFGSSSNRGAMSSGALSRGYGPRA